MNKKLFVAAIFLGFFTYVKSSQNGGQIVIEIPPSTPGNESSNSITTFVDLMEYEEKKQFFETKKINRRHSCDNLSKILEKKEIQSGPEENERCERFSKRVKFLSNPNFSTKGAGSVKELFKDQVKKINANITYEQINPEITKKILFKLGVTRTNSIFIELYQSKINGSPEYLKACNSILNGRQHESKQNGTLLALYSEIASDKFIETKRKLDEGKLRTSVQKRVIVGSFVYNAFATLFGVTSFANLLINIANIYSC